MRVVTCLHHMSLAPGSDALLCGVISCQTFVFASGSPMMRKQPSKRRAPPRSLCGAVELTQRAGGQVGVDMSRFRAFPYRGSLLRKMDGHVQEVFHEPISAKVPSCSDHAWHGATQSMHAMLCQPSMSRDSHPHV